MLLVIWRCIRRQNAVGNMEVYQEAKCCWQITFPDTPARAWDLR